MGLRLGDDEAKLSRCAPLWRLGEFVGRNESERCARPETDRPRPGEHDKALASAQKAVKLGPALARTVALEAQTRKLDSPLFHLTLYLADFLQHDTAGMEREAALASKPGYEDAMLYQESDTAAYAGSL